MKLKVYGTNTFVRNLPKSERNANGSTQKRVVMATTSLKKFAEALGVRSVSGIRQYTSVTANTVEVALCMAAPEQVFYAPLDWKKEFKPLPPL